MNPYKKVQYDNIKNAKLHFLAPERCTPPHKVTKSSCKWLLADMSFAGWSGRPLLGLPGRRGKIKLITGSHRWYCAKILEIPIIPVLVLNEKVLKELKKIGLRGINIIKFFYNFDTTGNLYDVKEFADIYEILERDWN